MRQEKERSEEWGREEGRVERRQQLARWTLARREGPSVIGPRRSLHDPVRGGQSG